MADIELVVGYVVARMSGVVDPGPSEAASRLHELVHGRLDGAPAWERAVQDAAGAEPLPNGTRMRLVIALKNAVAQDPEFAQELTALAARLGTAPPQVRPGTTPPAPQPATAVRTPRSGPAAPPTANRPEPQGGTPPPPASGQVIVAADRSVAVGELRGDLNYTLQEAAPGPVEWPLAIGRPPTPEPFALSRDEVGKELAKALTAHRSVLLSGPGGVGKSHVAAAHALRATADGTALLVLWADATDGTSLATSFAHAAWKVLPRRKPTGLEADSEAFLEWFRTPGPSALVVLDNLSDPALLAHLLPHSTADDRRVVITTRLRGSSTRSKVGAVVKVEPFTPAESLTFLRGRLAASEHQDPAGEEHGGALAELAAELEHLPLALGCAATALAEEGEPVAAYLDRLRQRAAGLDDMLPPDPTSGAPAVTAALLLSLDAAGRRRPTGAAGPARPDRRCGWPAASSRPGIRSGGGGRRRCGSCCSARAPRTSAG
ncbi:hypothetical protein ACI1MP_04585 [Kitasatospora griseola]|uniref:hypothetical protein n=1 Tax=Kitasatospora griseola TaxID=2064 RepID=UPI0038558CFE